MNFRIIIIVMFVFFSSSLHAETVVLKNGRVLTGNIIEKDEQKIRMQINNVPITYYFDDIQTIDGQEPVTVKKAVPVPVVIPEVTQNIVQTIPDEAFKKELILQFIDVFGTHSSLIQSTEQLIKSAPPEQAKEIQKVLNIDALIQELVPIYDKHFTQEELEAYVKFYSSKEGRKLVETIGLVMTESVGVTIKHIKDRLPQIPVQEIK